MRSSLKIVKNAHPAYKNLPPPPLPTLSLQKLSHSAPILVHLVITGLTIAVNLLVALAAHLLDGSGIRKSWNLKTTAVHSLMKSVLATSSPSGTHSLGLVRFITSFKLIPDFLFTKNVVFEKEKVVIQSNDGLAKMTRKALSIDMQSLRYVPSEDHTRTIDIEWIRPQTTDNSDIDEQASKVILYLHGGANIFLSPSYKAPKFAQWTTD